MNSRPPHITVGLRRLSVATHAALLGQPDFRLHDLRTRLAPNGSSCQDLPGSFVSDLRIQASLESDRRSCHDQLPISSQFPGMTSVRLTSAKPALACAMRLGCELATVTGRTLSQSVRTAHPFGLPFACSISGIIGSLQLPFPALLHAASGLRR